MDTTISAPVSAQEKVVTLADHRALIVWADNSIEVLCDKSFVTFLFAIARDAGETNKWEKQPEGIVFTNHVTFSTDSPYKAFLGSRGFTGLRGISVEIDEPHRVSIIDAGETYATKLAKESTLLLVITVLWRTTRSMK